MSVNGFLSYSRDRLKNKKISVILAAYLTFCIASAVVFCVTQQTRDILLSLGFTLFVVLLLLVEYLLKIEFSPLFTSLALFIAVGSILGSGYNLYSVIPIHDTVLHGLSGFLFAAFGYSIAQRLFSKDGKISALGGIIFAVCFSCFVGYVWELFEYGCTALFGFDMMEDTVVNDINSYFLAGNHVEPVVINGITKTVIHYGDGQTYVLNGYLDIGLVDTLHDMIICAVGTAVFCVLSVLGNKRFPSVKKAIIPAVRYEKNSEFASA